MTKKELKALVEKAFTDCEIQVEGEDGRFSLVLVGDCFAGLTPVKRQQTVYAAIGDKISSGAIHAVNIRALSQAESVAEHTRGG